eukprot:1142820-Pelagomonas_calceolata.AAC.1
MQAGGAHGIQRGGRNQGGTNGIPELERQSFVDIGNGMVKCVCHAAGYKVAATAPEHIKRPGGSWWGSCAAEGSPVCSSLAHAAYFGWQLGMPN